ncbi:TBC1 domain member 31 [Dinochytrium kinnereticum]|nr:TBC1 domain member 31 [Dinochytrium kinnereticum]
MVIIEAHKLPNGQTQPPRTVYVGDSKTGPIWKLPEWRKIVGGVVNAGTLLKVFNASPSAARSAFSENTQPFIRPIPFTCVAMSREMVASQGAADAKVSIDGSYSFVLASSDQRGHLFALDFPKNKFWLVARSGVSATCMAFNTVRRREIVVGLSDNSLHCYNIDTGQLVAKLPAYHRAEPHGISVHPSQPIAITTSRIECILWNTEKWERKRVLEGAGPPGVQQACFTPEGDSVVTAFNDGTILIWDSDSFAVRWKITLERFAADLAESPDESTRLMMMPRTSYVALSSDGELMMYGGLIISQIEFIGNTSVAAVLSSAGQMMFVNAADAQLVGQFKGKHLIKFRSFCLSPDGKVMALVLLNAKYSIRMLRVDKFTTPNAKEITDDLSDAEVRVEGGEEEKIEAPKVTLEEEKPVTLHDLVAMKEDSSLLNRRKLRKFVKHYGSYPEKYRSLIWRFLLRLPENRDSYEALLEKGVHPSYKDFRRNFPIKSERLAKSMERILSALAHWSPIFENLDYLPGLVFPFVKLFLNDMFSGLEVIMTILINWCQKWWDYFPNPPLECLDVIEDLMEYHDSELLAHFVKHKVTSQVYGWTCMSTLFAEIFSQADWLKVWDHMITNPPSFLYYFVVAYLRRFRTALLAITDLRDFKYFFTRRNPVSVDSVLIDAYRLHDRTPEKLSPTTRFAPFEPVLAGQYPIFNKFPEFIVNYQSKMKERIRVDEEDYLRKRKLADEVNRLTEELRKDKKNWEKADWKMNEMVEKWWDSMMNMEESHTERKARLDAMEKEQRARALRRIAEARRSFVDHQYTTTKLRANALARTVGVNARDIEVKADEDILDSRFREIEAEWLARREQMISAREELARLDRSRLEKLVRNARTIGVPRGMDRTGDGEEPSRWREESPLRDRSESPVRGRRSSPVRVDTSPNRLYERMRSWSPELGAERRFRRAEDEGETAIADQE